MQLPLNLIDPPAPSLAEGVVGRNAAALQALQAMADAAVIGQDGGHRPIGLSLYLWGVPGCGKTFWLRAWERELAGQARLIDCGPAERTSGGSSPQAKAAIHAAIEQMRSGASPRTWLIDNVDLADAQAADGLFQLYNAAREAGHRLVATAAVAPLRLSLRDDLRTRLGQSLIFELHELSDDEKKNALRERAEKLALPLSEDLLNYLLTRLPRDLGLLTRVVDALNQLSLSRQRPATLPLLKELLDSIDATTRPV